MITYLELWNAKDAWKNLTKEEKGEYLAQIGPAIQQLTEMGIEIVTWSVNAEDTHHRADYKYFAVWKAPSVEAIKKFEEIVDGAGWHDYFDQVNLMGPQGTPEDVIPEIMAE